MERPPLQLPVVYRWSTPAFPTRACLSSVQSKGEQQRIFIPKSLWRIEIIVKSPLGRNLFTCSGEDTAHTWTDTREQLSAGWWSVLPHPRSELLPDSLHAEGQGLVIPDTHTAPCCYSPEVLGWKCSEWSCLKPRISLPASMLGPR